MNDSWGGIETKNKSWITGKCQAVFTLTNLEIMLCENQNFPFYKYHTRSFKLSQKTDKNIS
jgi:hypothetical protein